VTLLFGLDLRDRLAGVIVQAAAGAGLITHACGTGGPTPWLPALVQCIKGKLPQDRALPKLVI